MQFIAKEIIIVVVEAVLLLPIIIIDYQIIKKISALGISEKALRKFNWIKYPIAFAFIKVFTVIIWAISQFGFGIALFENDVWALLLCVSELYAFGIALPVCDFMRYKILKRKMDK